MRELLDQLAVLRKKNYIIQYGPPKIRVSRVAGAAIKRIKQLQGTQLALVVMLESVMAGLPEKKREEVADVLAAAEPIERDS